MTNIYSLDKRECTGCGACFNTCPVNAISMKESDEGFLYPVVDENKCTNCGLCEKKCPILHCEFKNNKKPDGYAFMSDDEIRKVSTSGGAFTIVAYEFLKQGGYVAGAVFNNDCSVSHIVSNKAEDIERMRKSKYLQSDIKDCFKQIKELLKSGKKVLFSGTPCQVAGLKSFIGEENKNLFCIDIICHGTPSPKVFRKYIKEEKLTEEGEVWLSTDFRDKTYGWVFHYLFTSTKTNKKSTIYDRNDTFMASFLKNLCLRNSCETCKFAQIPRQGDITIGDFWGVKEEYDDNLGTSAILINNDKGAFLYKILKKNAKLMKKVPLKSITAKNPNLKRPTKFHKDRNLFFQNLDKMTLKDNLESIISNKCDCMIINFWYAVNYGASLTCWGVQCLLEKLGKKAKVINYNPKFSKKLIYKGSFAEEFAEKYLNLTTPCKNYIDFNKLNNDCETFITGSDQVFSPHIISKHQFDVAKSVFLLDFAGENKRKLSYAASIGDFVEKAEYDDYKIFKHFLKQFDGISVREDEGKEILQNLGLDSTVLLDGAFHIPKEKLDEMTASYPKKEKYVGLYQVPYRENEWEYNVAKMVSEKLGLPLKKFVLDRNKSVEEWLAFIKNADFIISASYHAIVFGIIFNTPFLKLSGTVPQNRFKTLFDKLAIKDNSVGRFSQYRIDEMIAERNWAQINSNILKHKQIAEEWMNNMLNKPIMDKSQYKEMNYILAKSIADKKDSDRTARLLAQAGSVYGRYKKYTILSCITFGKLNKKYKQKRNEYKEIINQIKEI